MGELLKLHRPQSCVVTHDNSELRAEMSDLEPEEENAKAHKLWYKPLAWLGVIRPLAQGEDWPIPLSCALSDTLSRHSSKSLPAGAVSVEILKFFITFTMLQVTATWSPPQWQMCG